MCLGDLGQSHNSTDTLRHIVEEEDADMVVFPGDLTYADHYMPNGTAGSNPAIPGQNSYQPRWDSWVC